MALSPYDLRSRLKASKKERRDWISLAIPAAGLLISAAIGGSTWVDNNAKHRSDEYSDFRDFADSEIAFWGGLYDKYMGTFEGAKTDDGGERRRTRLLAIADLIQVRTIPDFAEFQDVALDRKCAIIIRLENVQTSLRNNLDEQGRLDKELGEELKKRFRSSGAATDERCNAFREGGLKTDASNAADTALADNAMINESAILNGATQDAAQVQTSALPSQAQLVTAKPTAETGTKAFSGPSDSGWDVDIFWCEGANGDLQFQRATALGASFGDYAASGRAIAPGVKLGRVRIRPANADYQKRPGSAARWNIVMADSGPGELEAATAITASANAVLGEPLFRTGRSDGVPTKWYISVFLCP